MQTTNSEVAQLLARIEQEHASCVWALTGLAEGTARHDFIQHGLERIAIAHEGLSQLIGEQQAAAALCAVFERSPAQSQHACPDPGEQTTEEQLYPVHNEEKSSSEEIRDGRDAPPRACSPVER